MLILLYYVCVATTIYIQRAADLLSNVSSAQQSC